MIFYSHWLDLIGKLFSIVFFTSALFFTKAVLFFQPALEKTPNPRFFGAMVMTAALIGFYFAFHRPLVDVIVTKLYVRLRFGISISWEDAKLFRRLFCLNLGTMKWHPMTHVRSMPLEQRLPALMEALHAL
jgi:hypothetical protein